MEVRKDAGWSEAVDLFHYRTQTGQEVDLVLEDAAGRLVGIEVKASATITLDDFKGCAISPKPLAGRSRWWPLRARRCVLYRRKGDPIRRESARAPCQQPVDERLVNTRSIG